MARSTKQNDDLLMEDIAGFLEDEPTAVDELKSDLDKSIPSDAGKDGWEEPDKAEGEASDWEENEEFPGQLAVDVYETTDKLIVKARTAGVTKQDLDVSISDNMLTISGVLNAGEDDSATRWHLQECYWGEFTRTLALPVPVKEQGTDASLNEGVLTISFVKEKGDEPKKISIK